MSSTSLIAALETMRQRVCAGIAVSLEAAAYLASQRPDGSWADVAYANDNLKDWAAAAHLLRLRALAAAWYHPSPLQGRDDVRDAVLRGLDYWYALDPKNPNWWWNEIGAPLQLGETLLFIKGACDRAYIERAEPAFLCHQPSGRFTGQNLIWVSKVAIYHGILTDRPELASQGYIQAGNEMKICADGEGIQPDMSFHQHGKLLYAGGYGQGFADDVSRIIALADGTAYAWPARLVDRLASYLLDGSRWMVRGRTFDPGAIGREITREGHAATAFLTGLRTLATVAHARQAETRAAAAIDPADGRSLVTGNRYFWCSDLMTQHRPAYYLSVRVTSPRVLNADMACCGGEGRRCHHMAEGATFIMRDGDEYRDLYPVWNWRQIPGTTVVQYTGDFDPDALRGFGERAFAGGASDGRVGCAAMDFSRGELRARKGWFLFDEGMVALGAGITASAAAPVRTTLNQCHWRGPAFLRGAEGPLARGAYPLAAGDSFWHDGVTYHLFDGAGTLQLHAQSGAWSDCGVGSAEPLTRDALNAGLDHGVAPDGATYAYAALPGVAADVAFADDPARFVIVRNDPALQAVWHAGEQRGHAVFYAPGTVTFPDGQQISADLPCIVLYHPREADVTLTLAQPEQRPGLITLALRGRITTTLGVSLSLGEYAGSSQTLVWR